MAQFPFQGPYGVTSGSITGINTWPMQQTMTSTSDLLQQALFQQATVQPAPPPLAQAVAMMADGHLLVTFPFGAVKIPPALFKDLVALATMGLLEKMAPEEAEHGR